MQTKLINKVTNEQKDKALERTSTHCAAGKCDAVGDVAFIIPILWWTYLKILKRCPSKHDVIRPSEHGTN